MAQAWWAAAHHGLLLQGGASLRPLQEVRRPAGIPPSLSCPVWQGTVTPHTPPQHLSPPTRHPQHTSMRYVYVASSTSYGSQRNQTCTCLHRTTRCIHLSTLQEQFQVKALKFLESQYCYHGNEPLNGC